MRQLSETFGGVGQAALGAEFAVGQQQGTIKLGLGNVDAQIKLFHVFLLE
jgi:hypothetical protein